jgi:allophanate hydrolase subunit 1
MSGTDVAELAGDVVVAKAVLDYGDQALMLECSSTADALAWTAALRAAVLPGVVDIVPASRTVLVKLNGQRYQGVTRRRLRKLRVTAVAEGAAVDPRDEVVIDVSYDGPDLAEVADRAGLTTAQVINAHTATPWRVGSAASHRASRT